jgi:hypothetical protein
MPGPVPAGYPKRYLPQHICTAMLCPVPASCRGHYAPLEHDRFKPAEANTICITQKAILIGRAYSSPPPCACLLGPMRLAKFALVTREYA